MKIRNGFVSNSSSSSFIIKDIKKREDPFLDYPCKSSMTDFIDDKDWYSKITKIEQKSKITPEEQKIIEDRNVYHISNKEGHKYTVAEINEIIKKYGHSAKCLESYESDWKEYLESYDCIIMRITDIGVHQAKEIADMSWGKTFIWNKCSFAELPIALFNNGNINMTRLQRSLAYTNNPMFRMFVNSYEFRKSMVKSIKYVPHAEQLKDGRWIEYIEDKPEWKELNNTDITDIFCRWCRKYDGAICYTVGRAIDEGDIYIYAKENYLSSDCIDEILETCQCIMYAPHMG